MNKQDKYIKIRKVYDDVNKLRKNYGILKKCEFHIHTPASYDYRLYDDWKPEEYKNISDIDLLKIAVEEEYITEKNKNELKDNIEYYRSENYIKIVNKKGYKNFKEYLSYLLIAHKLYEKEVEVAVISDHNTIEGYKKLKTALIDYYKQRRDKSINCITLFLGVEISCSERNHVIGIFNDNKYVDLEEYLRQNIISEEYGTYQTSLTVISDIKKMKGIPYIAHINSSDLYGSEGYKKTLFNGQFLLLGLSNIEKRENVLERIKPFNANVENEYCFIAEGDSHALDTLGKRNNWIKFNQVNFQALQRSLRDYRVCVYLSKPCQTSKFIKGVLIEPGEFGFLKGKEQKALSNNEIFKVDFSSDLNCIIGGRGTGKSTLLNIIEVALTLECNDEELLKFISKHKIIYIIFYYNGVNYILRFLPQIKTLYDDKTEVEFLPKAFTYVDGHKYLSKYWRELYRINDDSIEEIDEKESIKIITEVYKRSYSINKIISKIDDWTITDFIKNIVMNGVDYQEVKQYIIQIDNLASFRIPKYLRGNLLHMIDAHIKQKKIVLEKISGFNNKYSDQLEICYSERENKSEKYLDEILKQIGGRGNVAETFLTWNDLAYFVLKVSEMMGYLNFLDCLYNKKYSRIEEFLSLSDIVDKESITTADIDKGLSDVDKDNIKLVYDELAKKFVNKQNCNLFVKSIEKWFQLTDEFSIRFNVNYKESAEQTRIIFKSLSEISMGQKVAAILSFVFNFGNFVGDNTPLVIDQPEDNLDNQYIYKNLVESLRKIKNERQVILVTHSAAIVTNADAEQVIVLDSNNINGWIQARGYPSKKSIVNHVINYLEGGKDSFINKYYKYRLIIGDLK